jgi:hypothetical protein
VALQVADLAKQAMGASPLLRAFIKNVHSSRETIMANEKLMNARREQLYAGHSQIAANQARLATLLAKQSSAPPTMSDGGATLPDGAATAMSANCAALFTLEAAIFSSELCACEGTNSRSLALLMRVRGYELSLLMRVQSSQTVHSAHAFRRAMAWSLVPMCPPRRKSRALSSHPRSLRCVVCALLTDGRCGVVCRCACEARSRVQENQQLISKNYTSAFNGSRQMSTQNTEDLYRNRLAVLRTLMASAKTRVQRECATARHQRRDLDVHASPRHALHSCTATCGSTEGAARCVIYAGTRRR